MARLQLGCIADDLTGATDLAALAARTGRTASVLVGVPDDGEDISEVEVIALKIRTAPPAEAVEQALDAVGWLAASGAQHFYWKYCSTFDSTAEGNIGPVAEALARYLSTPAVVHCPAFPENGRTVYMGNLFVGEQRLDESPMKDHPLTPMRDANLMRLLGAQVRGAVGHVSYRHVLKGSAAIRDRIGELAASGMQHVIADAIVDDDLLQLAQACSDRRLLAGGSAFAMQRLRAAGPGAGEVKSSSQPAGGRALVVAGSCSAATQAQVRTFKPTAPNLKLDPIELHERPQAMQAALDWVSAQTTTAIMVYGSGDASEVAQAQERLGRDVAGAIVEEALAAIARRAVELGFERLIVAGGETSGAVLQALGIRKLNVGPEIAPGVPWTSGVSSAELGRKSLELALKSGNFGGSTFFRDALEMT